MERFDLAIVGGGIVGLATGYQYLRRYPQRAVVLFEKEDRLCAHQSGHNSGVLHSGIYYRPGTLRAENCRDGKLAMQDFCREENLPFEVCGKVIVAIDESEVSRLEAIYERGQKNRVRCEMIDRDRLSELEPHAAGVRAIHVPEAGIVDYPAVCARLAERITEAGGAIQLSTPVIGIESISGLVRVRTTTRDIEARAVVTCAGLYADRIARLSGTKPAAKIVPFRGEYFELVPEAWHLCRNLIYPVPDPSFPFLGVHLTRMIHGGVECGPNAVFAFAREGYTKSDVNPRDTLDSLFYPGFMKLAAKHWLTGMGEMWRSFSKGAFVKALQRLVPALEKKHLEPAPAGVRAQAIDPQGKLVDDFLIQSRRGIVNVINAPSPAATASLNIGKLIVERLD